MTINDFAATLRTLKPGYRFIGNIPVRVATTPVIRAGNKTRPQRVYVVFGRQFSVALEAAAWAVG